MADILISIVDIAGKLYISIVLLRFLLQMTRADFYNPICQFIVKLTHPLLRPLRQIIPSIGRQDIASLVLAYLLTLAMLFIKVVIILSAAAIPATFPYWQLFILAFIELINLIFYLFYLLFIGSVILSWIAPDSRSAAASLINHTCDFILAPLRRIIPPLGIFDITPMVALIILMVINNIIFKAIATHFGLGI